VDITELVVFALETELVIGDLGQKIYQKMGLTFPILGSQVLRYRAMNLLQVIRHAIEHLGGKYIRSVRIAPLLAMPNAEAASMSWTVFLK
jgi:hypothetical protein